MSILDFMTPMGKGQVMHEYANHAETVHIVI